MRVRLLCSFLLLVSLLVSAVPTQAALIPVDPTQPTRITDSVADYQKIVRLRDNAQVVPYSPASPDDRTMLVLFARSATRQIQYTFLDIQSGSFRPITPTIASLPPLSERVWTSNDTLAYLSLAFNNHRLEFKLVTLNAQTGDLKADTLPLAGIPLSLSPGAKRILMVPFPTGGSTSSSLKSPFDLEVKRGFSTDVTRTPFGEDQWNDWLNTPLLTDKSFTTGFENPDSNLHYTSYDTSLVSLDLSTGKAAQVASLPTGTGLYGAAWSPDASRLALVRSTLSNIGRQGNVLSDLANQDGLGQLPPEKNPFLQGNTVDLVDFQAGSTKLGFLKAADGGDVFSGRVSWNTDGTTLLAQLQKPGKLAGRAFPTYLFPQSTYLRFYDVNGQAQGSLERDEINAPSVSSPTFISPTEVMIAAASGTNVTPFYYNRATGEFRKLPTPDGTIMTLDVTHGSHQVIFSHSSFVQAPELYRINLDGSAFYRYTFINEDLSRFGRVRADGVSFTLANGQVRTGYILQKADAPFPPANVPLIMWQEGGPSSPFLNQWATNVENPFDLLPNFGMAILFVPLEGRDGFGPARYNALADNKNFGQIDIDEGAEIMQQAISRGYTSPGKTGITGCSYGGYFTSQSITRHPDLYAAANTQCTLLDLFNEWSFGYSPYVSYLMGRTPLSDPQEYTNDSPLYNSSKIKTPTLIFDGTRDFLPYQLSVNFHDQIQANNVAVNMLVFKREGHGLAFPTSQLIAAQAQISWFQQYLAGARPAAPTSSLPPVFTQP